MGESFLNGKVILHRGDCLEVLATLEADSVDSCVTDPPYHLTSIVKRFGGNNAAPAQFGTDGAYARASKGFMGKQWDGVEVPKLDAGLGHWLAGFADGEGCFTCRKQNSKGFCCEFIIHVRADDAKALKAIHEATGIGDIRGPTARGDGSAPMVKWIVSRQRDCAMLVQIFRAFPLRAKKARDFEIWASAVEEWIKHEPGTSWEDLASHSEMLSAVKTYGSSFHPSQLFHYRWAKLVYRALKPGGHLLAFCGTRTYHRLAAAIEDAGFEIRDQIGWCYGSGFPKSHDVSKAIDRMAGAEREVIGRRTDGRYAYEFNGTANRPTGAAAGSPDAERIGGFVSDKAAITAPATEAAIQWQGWGTALKPAWEPICLARKPLSESSIAANVLKHGTGGINVDGCRIEASESTARSCNGVGESSSYDMAASGERRINGGSPLGRWPANLIHDGSEEVLAGFPDVHGAGHAREDPGGGSYSGSDKGDWGNFGIGVKGFRIGDAGSAARFFYTAKADSDDRLGSKHPTVKPLDLMQYLARLITPKGGLVLDPFAGTGPTGEAAWREGMKAILIEREAEYQADIVKRMGFCLAGPDTRRAAATKQQEPFDLPLFTKP